MKGIISTDRITLSTNGIKSSLSVNGDGLIVVEPDPTLIGGLSVTGGQITLNGTTTINDITAALFVGDSGDGGAAGFVPAPSPGDATKFLRGDGAWSSATGIVTGYRITNDSAWLRVGNMSLPINIYGGEYTVILKGYACYAPDASNMLSFNVIASLTIEEGGDGMITRISYDKQYSFFHDGIKMENIDIRLLTHYMDSCVYVEVRGLDFTEMKWYVEMQMLTTDTYGNENTSTNTDGSVMVYSDSPSPYCETLQYTDFTYITPIMGETKFIDDYSTSRLYSPFNIGFDRAVYSCGGSDVARWSGYNWVTMGLGISSSLAFDDGGHLKYAASGVVMKYISNDNWFEVGDTPLYDPTDIAYNESTDTLYAATNSYGAAVMYKISETLDNIWHNIGSANKIFGSPCIYDVCYNGGMSNVGLYVAGLFDDIDGVTDTLNIAFYDGAWHAMGTGVNGIINTIISDGINIYIGGSFTTAGGTPCANVAMWDGEAWYSLGSGIPSSAVTQLAHKDSGEIFAITNEPIGAFYKWDGVNWVTVPTSSPNSVLRAICYNASYG